MFVQTDCTDLFYIDDDMEFPEDAVLRLLNHPVKVVGGAYPIKNEDEWHYASIPKMIEGTPIGTEDGTLLRAESVAGGFIRIKRIVIEEMIKAYPETRYVEYDRESYNLFGTYIENGYLWGDDYSFCNRWKKIGGELWIDPNIDFGHIGFKTYAGNYWKYLEKLALHQKENENDKSIPIPSQ